MTALDEAVKRMVIGKAPGQDGLTSSFYKIFSFLNRVNIRDISTIFALLCYKILIIHYIL